MAYVQFTDRVPCGLLIVSDDDDVTTFVQSDWSYPSVASATGFVACECGGTDGTIDCAHHTADDMISSAVAWLHEVEGDTFAALDEYLNLEA